MFPEPHKIYTEQVKSNSERGHIIKFWLLFVKWKIASEEKLYDADGLILGAGLIALGRDPGKKVVIFSRDHKYDGLLYHKWSTCISFDGLK